MQHPVKGETTASLHRIHLYTNLFATVHVKDARIILHNISL